MKTLSQRCLLVVGACSAAIRPALLKLIDDYQIVVLADTTHAFEVEKTKLQYDLRLHTANKANFNILFSEVDVCNIGSVSHLIKLIEVEQVDSLDILYAAGINSLQPPEMVSVELWQKLFDVNVRGFFFIVQSVLRSDSLHNKVSAILAIASQHGTVVNYSRSAYCASKSALIQLVKQLAFELASRQIRVNSISPTFIKTHKNAGYLDSLRSRQEYLRAIPMGRYAYPDDLVGPICFLLSDQSSFITGVDLLVDGGYSLK